MARGREDAEASELARATALEILIDEAAKLGEASSTYCAFRLTQPQQLLGIDKHVAYIASLVLQAS